MQKKSVFGITLVLTIAILNLPLPLLQSKEDNDVAVPAFNDLALAEQQTPLAQKQTLLTNQLKPFDLNYDLQLNEFDAKQFQAVIESLSGDSLTGKQLASKFHEKQERQKESFLVIYDLNRDGRFSYADVEAFAKAVQLLDEPQMTGDELIYKFREKILPLDEIDLSRTQ